MKIKGKTGYGHFARKTKEYGFVTYYVGWYTDSVDSRVRYPKQHKHEVDEEYAKSFCNYHKIEMRGE